MLTITQRQFDTFVSGRTQDFLVRLRTSLLERFPSLSAVRPDWFSPEWLTQATQQIGRVGFSEELHVAALIAFAFEEQDGALDAVLAHPAFARPYAAGTSEDLRFREVFPALAGMGDRDNAAFAPLMGREPQHIAELH